MTIQERIERLQTELADTDMPPARARKMLAEITGLSASAAHAYREAESAYAGVVLHAMRTEDKANRARIVAETSQEFADKRYWQDVCRWCSVADRTLRAVLRSNEEEMRMSR